MEKEKHKPGTDLLLIALRCTRASLLLSSLRHSLRSTTTTTSSSSSSMELALRNAGLLDAELAAARREAGVHARVSAAELALVVALLLLLLLLLLFIGLLAGVSA